MLQNKARHKTICNLDRHPNGIRLDCNIRLERKYVDNVIKSNYF